MRDDLLALEAELRRLKRDGVSRITVDEATLAALKDRVRALKAEIAAPAAVSPAPVAPVPAAPVRPAAEPVREVPVAKPAPVVETRPPVVAQAPAPVLVAPPAPKIPAPLARIPVPATGEPAARLAALDRLLADDPVTRAGLVRGLPPLTGDGATPCSVLFLIHMPGADDALAGRVLSGAEGELFGKILKAMGMSRETVHTAAVIPYRPELPSGTDREPHRDEYAYYEPYLRARLEVLKPEVIVALGNGAMEAMFGPGEPISKTRGLWREFAGIPVMPTFHISYLIRNNTDKSKRIVWLDLLAVMEKLGLPISGKQRGYFAPKA